MQKLEIFILQQPARTVRFKFCAGLKPEQYTMREDIKRSVFLQKWIFALLLILAKRWNAAKRLAGLGIKMIYWVRILLGKLY